MKIILLMPYFLWHVLAFLILDDLTQYLWHRFSHENAFYVEIT